MLDLNSINYALLSALFLASNSLYATKSFKSKSYHPALMSAVSLLPSFLLSLALLPQFYTQFSSEMIATMIFKDLLYGGYFYIRYNALKKHGGFAGALLIAAQPAVIALLANFTLGESLGFAELWAVSCVGLGVFFLKRGTHAKAFALKELISMILLPASLFSVVAICDRYLLLEGLSGEAFFVLDKTILLPCFIGVIFFLKMSTPVKQQITELSNRDYFNLFVAAGIFWLLSSFFYGMALKGETAVWVSVIRNLSFPVVSLASILFFKEEWDRRSLLGLIFCAFAALGKLF